MIERLRQYRNYLAALGVFLTSRLIMFMAVSFAYRVIPYDPEYSGTWDLSLPSYRPMLRWDSGWYLSIVNSGYFYNPDARVATNIVFYPLYPLIAKLISLTGVPAALSLLLVANASIGVAIILLFKLLKDEFNQEIALRSVALMSFFPTALFFSAGYTESLTLLLVVAFFLLLKKENFLLAALVCGLATATRSTGVVLVMPLLWGLWRKFSNDWKKLAVRVVVFVPLASMGLAFFMLYLWYKFGKPLAFMAGTSAWHHESGVGSGVGLVRGGNLFQALTLQPFLHLADLFNFGFITRALDPWFFLISLVLLLVFRKRLPVTYFLYGVGVLLLPYLSLSASLGFQSFSRYLLLAFPVFVILAGILDRREWVVYSLNALFAALLFMYTALFARWYWAG